MKKPPPLIGITSDMTNADHGAKSEVGYFLAQRYVNAVVSVGAIPLILPPVTGRAALHHLLSRLNGLILSGGDFDIHPSHYNEKPLAALGKIKAERSIFELALTKAALAKDLPVLGICGGAQAINVVQGGTLYQDIGSQLPRAQEHQQSRKVVKRGHPITVQTNTLLDKIVYRRRMTVSTTHHQAVKALGRGLIVNALAPDGIVEGIESINHSFVLGLQWHPEVLAPKQHHQRAIFAALASAAQRRRIAK